MKHRSVFVNALLAVIAAFGLASCSSRDAAPDVAAVAAKINQTLPKPYVDGLVIEHAHVDNDQLVMDIRYPGVSIKQIDPKKLPLMQNQELGDLNHAACGDPDLAALLKRKLKVAHRFIDRDGKLIFQVATTIPNCNLLK